MLIHVLKAQGLSVREIARRLGVSRNTVTRYLASPDVPRYKAREARATKLEPFHAYIARRMQAAEPDQIAAPALLRELKAQGARLSGATAQRAGIHAGASPDARA